MPEIHTRMLELAKEALSEQERYVAEVRTRAVTVLSAGTFVAGFMGHAAFAGPHPDGVREWLGVAIAITGLSLLGRSMLLVLGARRMTFALDPATTYSWLNLAGVTEQPGVDFELANRLTVAGDRNAPAVAGLERALELSLVGLLVLSGGLAVATALGS